MRRMEKRAKVGYLQSKKIATQKRKIQANASAQEDKLELEERRTRNAREFEKGNVRLQIGNDERKREAEERETVRQQDLCLKLKRLEQNITEQFQVNGGFLISSGVKFVPKSTVSTWLSIFFVSKSRCRCMIILRRNGPS